MLCVCIYIYNTHTYTFLAYQIVHKLLFEGLLLPFFHIGRLITEGNIQRYPRLFPHLLPDEGIVPSKLRVITIIWQEPYDAPFLQGW